MAPARVTLVPGTPRAQWEKVCDACPDATAFHRYDFLQSVAPAVGCQFVPLLVLVDGEPAGVAPLLVKQLGPYCTINWVPFPYLGPLVPLALLPATMSALRREASRRRALNHQQSFSRAIGQDAGDGFTARTERTFVVPLADRSDADLMAAMQKKRREEIRRAQRTGFEVRPAQAEDFPLMDGWLSQMYADQGLSLGYQPGTGARVFAELEDTPGSVGHVARLHDRTVAMAITFSTGRRAFGWLAAADPSHRSGHPQALLTWHALLAARDCGATEFDLVGAPSEGIATYKRRFGAAERSYTVLRRQAAAHRIALAALARLSRPAASRADGRL